MEFLNKTLIIFCILGAQAHAGIRTQFERPVDSEPYGYTCDSTPSEVNCSLKGTYFKIDGLRQVISLVVGTTSVCALNTETAKCWRLEGTRAFPVEIPKLKNPRQITGAADTVCALDDQGAKCWTFTDTAPAVLKMPELHGPIRLSANTTVTCAVEKENGAKCWKTGSPDQPLLEKELQSLKSVEGIAVSENDFCVRYNNLISGTPFTHDSCWRPDGGHSYRHWAVDYHKERDFSAFYKHPGVGRSQPEFNLDQIYDFTDLLMKVSSPVRARFFNLMLTTTLAIDMNPEHAAGIYLSYYGPAVELDRRRYVVLRLMEPAIQSGDSTYYTQKLLPAYEKSLASIEEQLQMKDLSKIQRTKVEREIALRTIQAALTTLIEFVPLDEKQSYAHLPRLIGQAILDPGNTPALTDALDRLSPKLQALERNPRAAFLVKVINTSHEFFRGWVWAY